jgi:hypothetical protein
MIKIAKIVSLFLLIVSSTNVLSNTSLLQQKVFRYMKITNMEQAKKERKILTKEIRSLAKTSKELENLKTILNSSIAYSMEYQKELWLSAKLSYENKKVILSKNYLTMSKGLVDQYKKSLPYKQGTSEYKQALSAYESNIEKSNKNSELMLEKAAKRTKWILPDGRSLDFSNLNLINTTIKSLEAQFENVKKLIDGL